MAGTGGRTPGCCQQDDRSSAGAAICGMSGRLPRLQKLCELQFSVLQAPGFYGLSSCSGKLHDLAYFDAQFFGVPPNVANRMNPMIRIMLEVAYEAIMDAGVNPQQIAGTRTGVFVAASGGGSSSDSAFQHSSDTGALIASAICKVLHLSGPSSVACCSSMAALYQAVTAMRTGECDAAVVGGINLCLDLHELGLKAAGSATRHSESPCGRSEAAVALYLQKPSEVHRIYATIVSMAISHGGTALLSESMQKQLLHECYQAAGVDPADVFYVETHCTDTKADDCRELSAIASVLCEDRASPLLIGCVKNHIGDAGSAFDMCSVAKVLLAMECGTIPPSLRPEDPRTIWADGKIRVAEDCVRWKGGLAGVNSIGADGVAAHAVLRCNERGKSPAVSLAIPRLAIMSASTAASLSSILGKAQSLHEDEEFLSLLQDIHKTPIPGHRYRGYVVLRSPQVTKETSRLGGTTRPLWLVFPGLGSQCDNMARDLMQLPVCVASLEKCAQALVPLGVDLIQIVTSSTEVLDLVNVTSGIVAVQIALVDLLTSLGLRADGMVGHSAGELVCGYADGTFTAEQTVLAAYWLGKTFVEAGLPPGAMYAVGLTWEQAQSRCPAGISPACHNAAGNVTVSGPQEDVRHFGQQLQAQGILAVEVQSCGFAFHSEHVTSVGPELVRRYEQVIPSPKQRSSRWVSSSVPEAQWDTPLAQTSSAAYHANNILVPVLFVKAVAHIPADAIVVELAPRSILQSLLRHSLPHSCMLLGLIHKQRPHSLLANLGRSLLQQSYFPTWFPVD